MRLILITLALVSFSGMSCGWAPLSAQSAAQNETRGVCSPITPNNQGSITINCSGFNDKQYRVLRDFLNQLSSDQSKEQDVLLDKLNEILDAVKRNESLSKPRVIPDSVIQQIARDSWGTLPISNILVIAPSDDVEAENFARQIEGIFDRGGENVRIAYEPLKRGADDPDVKIVQNSVNSLCAHYFTMSSFASQISIKMEAIKPPAYLKTEDEIRAFDMDPSVPLDIYVYPKKL